MSYDASRHTIYTYIYTNIYLVYGELSLLDMFCQDNIASNNAKMYKVFIII